MSSSNFRIDKHVVPCSHIRQYARSTVSDQEDTLYMAVKQYTPLDNLNPRPGDVTIIAAHANGFSKEVYEPLWDDLYHQTKASGNFRIRAIWMTDVAWQGESSVLNEDKLGDDPNWYDHPRDLLNMINVFRTQMHRPLVGFGHSFGGHTMVSLALIHPRLFAGLILCDPVLQRVPSIRGNFSPPFMSTFRRDIWPSRAAAAAAFRRNKFYQTWDPRVLNLWIEHGLRDLPTPLYPTAPTPASAPTAASASTVPTAPVPQIEPTPPAVTLKTTKLQEVLTFIRPARPLSGPSRGTATRRTHPDFPATAAGSDSFYSPAPLLTFAQLPSLRPRTGYIFASESDFSAGDYISDKLAATGSGPGGNGGVAAGGTRSVTVAGAGHFVPFERPGEVARIMADFFAGDLAVWREDERLDALELDELRARSKGGAVVLSDEFVSLVKREKKALDQRFPPKL